MLGRDNFLQAMRRVASSVTVVTTDGPHGRHGATVSAFCSVSADPPSVLICLRADSRIESRIQELLGDLPLRALSPGGILRLMPYTITIR